MLHPATRCLHSALVIRKSRIRSESHEGESFLWFHSATIGDRVTKMLGAATPVFWTNISEIAFQHPQGPRTFATRRKHFTVLLLYETTLKKTFFILFIPCIANDLQNLQADSNIACRAHAVPLPCLAAKGLECVFPI